MSANSTFLSINILDSAKHLLKIAEQLAPEQAMILICEPSGRILSFNDSARKILNHPASKINQLSDLVPAEDQRNFNSSLKELSNKNRITFPLTDISPSGFVIMMHCSYLEADGASYLCCMLTEELLAKQAIPVRTLSEDDYKAIFDNSLEYICILDQESNIIDLNKAALRFSDYCKEDMIGRPIGDILEFNDFEKSIFLRRLNHALAGSEQKFDWWFKDKDKELVTVEIILRPATYLGQKAVIARAIDAFKQISSEKNVRFRNSQLEFVNSLLTHLAKFKTSEEILHFTLDQLLEKTDIIGGAIYLYQNETNQLNLLDACGTNSDLIKQYPQLKISRVPEGKFTQKNINKFLKVLEQDIKQTLPVKPMALMPVRSERSFVAIYILFLHNPRKVTSSFSAFIESIGNGLSQYITKHELYRQLNYSESKYQILFDSSSDAIILSDECQIIDCNRAVQAITGISKDKILKTDLISLLSHNRPEEEIKIRPLLQKTLDKGKQITFAWRPTPTDSVFLETDVSFNRLLIEGKFYIQTIIRDVTQKKQALAARRKEEVLTESINQFRDLISQVEMAYVSLDLDGNMKYVNTFFLQLMGYETEDLVGRNYFETFAPPHEYENRLSNFKKSIANRTLSFHSERKLLTKTGEVKTLIWQRMFEHDADGNIIGINSLGKDVSDKKAAIEALRDNKSRLQDIFDNAHDLIQNISIDNKFIFVNKAWKEKLGYNDYDIEKLTLNDIVHPYYKAKLIYQLRNLYKGENVNKIETVFLTKSGKPVHLIGSVNCTYQNGQAVASRAILHDITDRIKAERLQKVYYSIANLAISSKDLNSLYGAIHRELSKIIETNNIYIALTDEGKTYLNFVYYVDQYKQTEKFVSERGFANGISEYIINTGKPQYLLKADLIELENEGLVQINGIMPEVILCSPLSVGDRIIGVIAVQDYRKQDAYVSTDIEILHFISNQVALAIERKRNEVQINNQNARLKAIFDSGSHLMWSLNRQGQLTSFNQNFAQTFYNQYGFYPEVNDLAKMEALTENDQEELAIWREKYELVFTGKPQHFEVRSFLKDGTEQWQEVFLNPIYLTDGTFEEISVMALDITEKKLSQLALEENEEKFRSIFESFQDVFFRTDAQGNVKLMSPSVLEMLGYIPDEVIGTHVHDFFQDANNYQLLLQKLNEKGRVQNFEARFVCKNGQAKDVLINANIILDKDGRIISLEGVARDIAEMKQIQLELIRAKEIAENSSQAKTQFLANMSHELRTPMNGIIGMIDLLYHSITTEEQREYVDTLRKSSDALLAILNDILDLSKIQAGKLELRKTGVDLHYTLDKINSLFINRANQKDLTFSYNITPHTPRFIITDETRLLQILSNLTSNAIKFTNSGKVHIQVNSIMSDGTDYTIMFRVKDSGIGISEQDKKILFTNFTQLDNSSTKSFGGTGLGLAISKQLSELLGGEIGVDSVYGEGSTFWFTICCKRAFNEAEILENRAKSGKSPENMFFETSPDVLLVDDNLINQKVAEKLLLRLGCRVKVASNGFEAIDKATSHSYDIIFMDIQMPLMDGVTATNEIKNLLKEDCPPIVAMTAYSMKDDAEKFLSQGLDDYVSKPVKIASLFEVIKRWNPQEPAENVVLTEDIIEESDTFIDENIMDQLKEIGGADFAKMLYVEFEEETEPLLEEATKEISAKHFKEILGTLHQIKGTSSTLGLTPFAEMAKTIEHDIRNEDFTQVEENFSVLLNHFNHFKKIYPQKFI